jgi:Flp pilus assembly protein TadG
MMLRMFKCWWKDDRAVIAIEVGILMPTMLVLLLGTIDIGMGIYINQKLLNAGQMIADLLTRNDTVSASVDLPNAVLAGQLTMAPYSTATFGVDVAGIQFNGGPTLPAVVWRYTTNMSANTDVPNDANNLGDNQDGVIVVTVVYNYVPFFVGGLTQTSYPMKEVAFARGRNGLFIPEVASAKLNGLFTSKV